ncbi:MAG: polysaccharide deacetylase family protein [Candidatus Omnitrophota bacterium]
MQSRAERYLKEIFSIIMRILFVPVFIREFIARDKVTIISYHDPDKDVFRAHMRYITRHYRIIGLDDLVAALRDKEAWRELPRKALVITMDDGFCGNHGLIPVLDEFKAPVMIFTRPDEIGSIGGVPGREGRYLNKSQMRDLIEHGASFGAHSMEHLPLTQLSHEESAYEMAGSKDLLEGALSVKVDHFSYPYGDYGARELGILRNGSRYRSARTVKPGWVGPGTDPYELPSMGVGNKTSVNKMVLDITGIFPFLRVIRSRFFERHFNNYKSCMSYVTGIFNLRGPIRQHTQAQAGLIKRYAGGRKRLVEIGVSEGGSALEALKVMDPKGTIWLIDPYRSILYPYFSLSMKIAKHALGKFNDRDIVFIRDHSYNAVKSWSEKIDYLLIDANHFEEGFMKDWNAWSRFVADDGVVLVQSTKSPSGLMTGSGIAIRRLLADPGFGWYMADKADATVVLKRKR